MTITERRAQALRLDLARTAARLFVQAGSTSVTVERIAEEAGVHARTFHRHFPVKEDVVVPLFAQTTESLIQALDQAPDDTDPAATLVLIWSPILREGFVGDFGLNLMRLIVQAPEYRFRWLQMDESLIDAVSRYLDRNGVLNTDPALRTLPAALLVQAVRHAVEHWVVEDSRTDVVELLERAIGMVMHGVAPHQPVRQRSIPQEPAAG